MNGKLKLLLGGLGAGLLFVFAIVGIKSMLTEDKTGIAEPAGGWQQSPTVTYDPGNIPSVGASDGSKIATKDVPAQDTGIDPSEKVAPQLVDEPKDDTTTPATTRPSTVPTTTPTTQPTVDTSVNTTTPPATAQQPAVSNGGLEVIAQAAEDNSPVEATIYVQKTNGTNVDAAASTAQMAFTLKPGLYKITVRAPGRASVSRNITVPPKAVVSEIFSLPLAAATATPAPTKPPVASNPVPNNDVADGPTGKLRVVALSADDGSPIKVDFTVLSTDGRVLNRVKDVSMSEVSLPAQPVVVRFNFRGFQGEQALTVNPDQTTTHTFNLRGASTAPPENDDAAATNAADPNNPPAQGNPEAFGNFLNDMQNPPKN